jgi:thymidylate synthase (FAD)
MVRHRLCAFSQESTRYCNYSKEKFGNTVVFIQPPWLNTEKLQTRWETAMQDAEDGYLNMIELGASPQIARGVLPNSLKTEIVVTANLREWRHIFTMRTALAAHPQMRQVMCPLLRRIKSLVPVVFDDVGYVTLPEDIREAEVTTL